ncbi:UNVERIFIED_CONTAM: Guanine nucleotide-binding protein G(i) subunit alpha-2 [Siphonaria sp. JEL0065]|nr:Guanine nucleotide-binding protein G(i) subunit alpha-2 [Siphonaria sp. JEL0065]
MDPPDVDTYAEWKAAKQISDQIDADLRRESIAKQKAPKGPKLILLGSGDSGKSTVLKQLKILRGGGFTDDERHEFKLRVWSNIVDTIKLLVSALDTLQIDLGSADLKADADAIQQFVLDKELPENIVESIRKLWNDSGIQSGVKRANELPEFVYTAEFYMNDLERHTKSYYVPTDEAPYFADDLSAIIFIAALSSYDQTLLEDPTINRMEDAISLFASVDLLQKKIESGMSPVEKYFPDYVPCDYKETGNWFKQKFHDQKKSKTKTIYTHFTTGTDTKNMDAIISAVQDIVLKSTLSNAGVL